MSEFFAEYKTIIVFLHVISAVVWVGGMIALRFAAHPSFMQIESPAHRLERVSHALKNLFMIVAPFILTLFITAIIMIKGYSISASDYKVLGYAKEGIWSVMLVAYIVMVMRRNRAQKAIAEGDFVLAKNQLGLIGAVMVPINITLGVIAIFIGSYFSSVL
ncbi:hypothetical protein GJV85_11660 [Sulfurimonas aquatica]|uniref:Copper resistance protein D domain-containing protein n=1 Tax=Sulfurimonas aquatica TaxID=2672570 RepID=A0A975GDH8_9BACT|nr:hypothetical protein [Sulfurimonas aquatica]QSZ42741.1 hypothetical protein GJV85_11660 [Sulfurimonas aquatica]